MEKNVKMLDLFAAYVEKNHGDEARVIIAVEAYVSSQDIFDSVRIITNATDEVIEETFHSLDDCWEYAIFEHGKMVESSQY
jgi:hypothetical protein